MLWVVIATGQILFIYSTGKSFILTSVRLYPLSTLTIVFPGLEVTRPGRPERYIFLFFQSCTTGTDQCSPLPLLKCRLIWPHFGLYSWIKPLFGLAAVASFLWVSGMELLIRRFVFVLFLCYCVLRLDLCN